MVETRSILNYFLIQSRRLLLIILDFLSGIVSVLIGHRLLEYPKYGFIPDAPETVWLAFLTTFFGLQFVVFYIADLYKNRYSPKQVIEDTPLPLSLAILLVFLGVAIFCYWTKFPLGRDVIVVAGFLFWVGAILMRILLSLIFHPQASASLIKPVQCLLIGKDHLTERLRREEIFRRHYALISPTEIDTNLLTICDREKIEIILLSSSWIDQASQDLIDELTHLKFAGVEVCQLAAFYERLTSRVPVQQLPRSWFLDTQVFNQFSNQGVLRTKRIFDLIVSFLLLPLVIPILLISCLIIILTSRGSPIYSQRRIGRNGAEFTVFKLRSMTINQNPDDLQWTQIGDQRITPFGRLIRSFKLDELPQLWNVLLGEMSLIGPRPERPELVSELRRDLPYYDLRHAVRPGLTGWAQVNAPLASPSESLEKLEYDLFYIRHLSIWLELDIILKTIRIVLAGRSR
ncbi:MAG: exopolysaccharide biosynthesis polyprenyl glycosylphosphotransferase [Candidatus Caenarcaniphilales bacterium]|nr:exopolysaccharide biosynthesis polyprenyl glycosylphosphotransferase [Candidatus Caenarcaniphilales bacterium]